MPTPDWWALEYLDALAKATRAEARRRRITIRKSDLALMTHTIPDLLLNLHRQEILFSPAPDNPETIIVLHRRARRKRVRRTETLTKRDFAAFRTPAGTAPFLLMLHPAVHRLEDREGMHARARFYIGLFQSEAAFNRNLGRVADLMQTHQLLGTAHVRKQSKRPSKRTQMEAGAILLVTALENFLRDAFFAHRHLWFTHLPEGPAREKAALDCAAELGLREGMVTDILADRSLTATRWLAGALGAETRLVSFQALTGRRSAKSVYKQFFGADLQEVAPLKAVQPGYWNDLAAITGRRHELVHGDRDMALPRGQLRTDVRTVYAFEKHVMAYLMERDSQWKPSST